MSKNQGFTLVEVLIALLIVAISLGAFLQTNSTTIHHTFLLKHTLLSQNLAWNQLVSQQDSKQTDYQFEKQIIKTKIKTIKKIQLSSQYQGKTLTTLTRFFYEK